MQASETKFQPIIEGTKQYVIPMFQRTYSWTKDQWEQLWTDISDLRSSEQNHGHFIGSVVSMALVSGPHEVQKYLLIDGQQRLTTLVVILAVLRDMSKKIGENRLADEIHETLLVNKYEDGDEYYKLLPTQVDRGAFKTIIDGDLRQDENSLITQAYNYFEKLFIKEDVDIREVKSLISQGLSIVSINLDSHDNPYLVFESLNAKGRPLTQSDLIRNFFFMRIPADKQADVYDKYWRPMQDSLGSTLTEYIRHFLMKDGKNVGKNNIYIILKDLVGQQNAIEHIKELYRYSVYYNKFLNPDNETSNLLKTKLKRINRLEVTTVYPFLLNIYSAYDHGEYTKDQLAMYLDLIENFLVRRFVCDIPTHQLSKIFPPLYQQIRGYKFEQAIGEFKAILQNKGYPKDLEFKSQLMNTNFYGRGDRAKKVRFILETIEESFNHKEKISFSNVSVEHIIPQTLTEPWKQELGTDWEAIHEMYLHTLGNLTLTAYNSELSNELYDKKRTRFNESHLELNKYFRNISKWNKESVVNRAEQLADKCLQIWEYFGDKRNEVKDVKGTSPRLLIIEHTEYQVSTWKDVWLKTLNTIISLDKQNFYLIKENYPNLVTFEPNIIKRNAKLENGAYINIDLSARDVYRLCFKILETVGIERDNFKIEIVS
ncbi:DUF262 domain-containing protein [Priestia megaterium]